MAEDCIKITVFFIPFDNLQRYSAAYNGSKTLVDTVWTVVLIKMHPSYRMWAP